MYFLSFRKSAWQLSIWLQWKWQDALIYPSLFPCYINAHRGFTVHDIVDTRQWPVDEKLNIITMYNFDNFKRCSHISEHIESWTYNKHCFKHIYFSTISLQDNYIKDLVHIYIKEYRDWTCTLLCIHIQEYKSMNKKIVNK